MIMKAIYMTMMTNPTKAKKTKKMQTSIQAAMAVIPSTFGEFVVTMLKMLINTLRGRTSVRFMTTMMIEMKMMSDITNMCNIRDKDFFRYSRILSKYLKHITKYNDFF